MLFAVVLNRDFDVLPPHVEVCDGVAEVIVGVVDLANRRRDTPGGNRLRARAVEGPKAQLHAVKLHGAPNS